MKGLLNVVTGDRTTGFLYEKKIDFTHIPYKNKLN